MNINLQVDSKRQSIALILFVALSVCFDVDWLSSSYVPDPLTSDENEMAYRIEQEDSLVQTFAWYGVIANMLMKVICLNYSLQSSKRGILVRKRCWERLNVFCTMKAPSDDINEAVKAKIIAILWIEITSLISCFTAFFIIDTKGVSSSLFQDGPMQMLSLQASVLYKGVTGVLVALSLFHHVRLRDFWTQCGCTSCCLSGHHAPERGRRRITTTLRRSSKCIVATKMTDFAIGVLLWINLATAHREFTRDVPTIVVFGLLVSSQIITCIVSPVLGSVVVW